MGCSCGGGPCRSALDSFFDGGVLQDALHVNARRDHAIRIERTWFDQFLNFGDRAFCRCGHHGIKVARRLAVDEIAEPVALPRLDEREVGVSVHVPADTGGH